MADNAPLAVPAHVVLNLIGPALVGGFAGQVDFYIAEAIARQAAGVPDVGTIHLICERKGKVVSESWVQSRSDGTGRHGLQVGEAARQNAYDVRVDLNSRPASNHLEDVLDAIERAGEPTGPGSATFGPFRNALAVTERAGWPYDPELFDVAALLRIHARANTVPANSWNDAVDRVLRHMRARRFALAMDAHAAAAMLIVAHVPVACAMEARHEDSGNVYRAFMLVAADQLRGAMSKMVKGLVEAAVDAGHLNALNRTSAQLLAEAVALRDRALESPADPVEFSRRLYDIPPYAEAAKLICEWTRGTGAISPEDETWGRRQTDAEELRARATEGLCTQYIAWINGHHLHQRSLVQAAQAHGDRRAVFRLLRDGEFRLLRPRSYRPFLEGKGPAPAIQP